MDSIDCKAYAKINLGLDVVRKREDGYHEVKMVMQNVGLYDELSFRKTNAGICLSTNLNYLPNNESNLVYKAIKLIKDEYNISVGISARLKKNIPVAAGMAGGSTDCAATLKAMNKLFNLNISEEKLMEYGKRLGADIPYCIMGGIALSEGIGEILTPLPKAPQCHVVVVKPNISVSTKYVYENLQLDKIQKHPNIDKVVEAIKNDDLYSMADNIENILETVTINKHKIISTIKEELTKDGAIKALMSGSGPTVFALFDNEDKAKKALDNINKMKGIKQSHLTKFVY